MANSDISIGDIVRLKSGGPTMTVVRVLPPREQEDDEFISSEQSSSLYQLECVWHESDGPETYRRKRFYEHVVKKTETSNRM